MKKFKIIVTILFSFALLTALAVGASAKWWEENPYTDVGHDAWYYDAARVCYENGVMTGVSETEFGVGTGMTRAMAVTALASASGYDKAAYSGAAVFDDVPAGKWYAAPVAWAYEKGLTAGTGDGVFSPDQPLTREQLAVMLYKYSLLSGREEFTADLSISFFPDYGELSSWARNAMTWAYCNKIVSGVGAGDRVLLSPKSTAAREQYAQMFVKYLAAEPVYEINGNDLSLYRIVYNKYVRGAAGTSRESAELLRDHIKNGLGIDLPVVSDETEPYEYEILVGRTVREIGGLVSVDLSLLDSDQQGLCTVQGDRLIIQGIDSRSRDGSDRTARNCSGTYNGVFFFAENVLGAEVYSDEEYGLCKYSPDPVISLPDGWTYIDGPYFKERIFYMSGGILGTGTYEEAIGTIGYGLSTWISGDFDHDSEHFFEPTPCLTDEDHIQAVITHVKQKLDENPTASL
ncbi:MAG: S-layer homology domain-containing protein, partial [Clostridia bacterium]|nr:S-layer homology domain-containing protein [Clostridia bacterium]